MLRRLDAAADACVAAVVAFVLLAFAAMLTGTAVGALRPEHDEPAGAGAVTIAPAASHDHAGSPGY
jgi:hypothetical protein